VQIHGCSRGAAAWIQPHCSNHTGRVRVVKTQQITYSSYNIYGNNLSILHGVLNKKKRLDTKECKTALLLRDTSFKLLRLKD